MQPSLCCSLVPRLNIQTGISHSLARTGINWYQIQLPLHLALMSNASGFPLKLKLLFILLMQKFKEEELIFIQIQHWIPKRDQTKKFRHWPCGWSGLDWINHQTSWQRVSYSQWRTGQHGRPCTLWPCLEPGLSSVASAPVMSCSVMTELTLIGQRTAIDAM